METVLTHPDASVVVDDDGARRSITVEPRDGLFVPFRRWETAYPVDLIENVLRVRGPGYLCEEIMRDEHPRYVRSHLHWHVLSYVGPEDLAGRRVLDFGSGSGASTMVLSRMFPDTTIVGVELVPEAAALAARRAEFHGVGDRVAFRVSPNPNALPDDIGEFDHVMLSAVYEHLLPDEREAVLARLWAHLRPGGILFIHQTPFRWFLWEAHTTGLPLLNYLPPGLALRYARRFSRRIPPGTTWPDLLRRGIRGATEREIMGILSRQGEADLLAPSRLGVNDPIDLWYERSRAGLIDLGWKLTASWWIAKGVRAVTGVNVVPSLSLAVRKAV